MNHIAFNRAFTLLHGSTTSRLPFLRLVISGKLTGSNEQWSYDNQRTFAEADTGSSFPFDVIHVLLIASMIFALMTFFLFTLEHSVRRLGTAPS
jgi:hypothetical protein